MLQRMPGFSKDTMRTTLCTLVFLFSLPWSLNGHLTTSNKNIAVTNPAENASRQRDYTTDSGTENVVSLSRRVQTQQLTSHSEQREIRLRTANDEDETSRTRRDVHYDKHNFTTTSTHPEAQMQDEVTQKKEQQKPTESSRRPHITSLLQTENATEFNVFAKPSDATRADVSAEEKTSSGLSETQKATQETPSTSDFSGLYDAQANTRVMETSNKASTNKDVPIAQPTMETSGQPSPMTHAHTSAIATVADFKGTLSTNGVKTTEVKEVTDKWTRTQGPELETLSTTKPKMMLTTTRKTTKKLRPPPPKDKQQANPGPAVGAVIGTTFVLMFIAIIFILVRKSKMQRKQLENPEWAGPSPFLDGDVQANLPNTEESEAINRQGFNQMSRYLSQRLSKHLTFGRNSSEEVLMGDILQGSTFGRQNPDEVQAPNGNPIAAQDSTETEENKILEGQESVHSSDTKTPTSGSEQETVKESKQTDDLTASMSSGPDTVIKPPLPLVSIDLDSLSEEAAPLQTSDGGIIPPAPPLP
ncbi:protein EVI2B [Onychostoma macrolepis]|uniref:protein EVI2B n=1 Tax=Onychostoma macrolepis TaxID=369639 RepID=UPI00272C13FF|nr:protein EVI2B [Onychostoma macrolepis]XP_058600854.1 protein EVI2B [Onychostoma macrolepis]